MFLTYQNLLFLLCGILAVSAFSFTHNETINDARIIGGIPAEPGSLPFQVALFNITSGNLICGGVIFDELRIITAAQCVQGINPNQMRIVAGATRIDQNELTQQHRNVLEWRAHPLYEKLETNTINDIAVINLDEPLQLNPYVQGLAINPFITPHENEYCRISGWGVTENGTISPVLRFIDLPMLSGAECQRQMQLEYPTFNYHYSFLCQSGGDAGGCNYDSGGPLLCWDWNFGYYLAGVVMSSGVIPCGRFPTLIADIHLLNEWPESLLIS